VARAVQRPVRRVALAASLFVAAACGGGDEAPVVASAPPSGELTPVEITGGEHDLSLDAWSFCWVDTCADGMPPDPLPDAGTSDELLVTFPAASDDWVFEATIGEPCGGETAELERIDDTTWRLVPLGEPGSHAVHLFGRGVGDLSVSFTWTTTETGPFTPPSAYASIVADHDGTWDSYGVEVGVSHLAAEHVKDASGTVVVTSSTGASHEIDLRRRDEITCSRSVHFGAPIEEGRAAAALEGGAPFTYEVTLTLDGATHVGRGTWPEDVDPECSPCVPLTFAPPLPARGPAAG